MKTKLKSFNPSDLVSRHRTTTSKMATAISDVIKPEPRQNMERRAQKRKQARFTMRYRILNAENLEEQTTTTHDVSAVSVAFESSELIPIGTAMRIELELPSMPKPIHAEGWINRAEELERGKQYIYALVFHIISDEDRQMLEKFVQLVDIDNILRTAVQNDASDVHLVANRPPFFRIQGELNTLEFPTLASADLRQMITSMLTERQNEIFEERLELDISYFIPEGVRFRVNVHLEKGHLEAAFRIIPSAIRTIQELGLPPAVEKLCHRGSGLIIVSGPTGSGKSTTLAAMLDEINKRRKCLIVSIEDPIEYVHEGKLSIIKQREVGADTKSFHNALKHVLRQDPDVILVGEIRDLESISMAITAAETGHLVLTTLHTSSSSECFHRLVDVYPANQQDQIRRQLAGCIESILVQRLLPNIDKTDRILATEIMIATPAIRNLIQEGKLSQMQSYMEAGSQHGMHTMDSSLVELVKNGTIDRELARGFMKNPQTLD
ncbi:MAG: PilT/PilU family type 4a pilus ATPase [Planctomycetota bacterium]